MIFFGARPAVCRNAGGSASSIVPIMRKCSSFAVHPEILRGQRLPDELLDGKTLFGSGGIAPSRTWRSISTATAPRIIKFFLHLSKDEQRKRLLERIDKPAKNWKFSLTDIGERKLWDHYMKAYEACLSATSTASAPGMSSPPITKRTPGLSFRRSSSIR